jgi:hypothetical protein
MKLYKTTYGNEKFLNHTQFYCFLGDSTVYYSDRGMLMCDLCGYADGRYFVTHRECLQPYCTPPPPMY